MHDRGLCTYWQFDTLKQAATVIETIGSGSANTTYTFTTPGVYLITLYVRDDDGGVGLQPPSTDSTR